MSPLKKTNLDLRKTIETTLRRAQKWIYACYPSAQLEGKKLNIDVRYFGEKIPSLNAETPNIKQYEQDVDYQKKPVYVCFSRGKTSIVLKRNQFLDFNRREKTSYSLHIHARSGHEYTIMESPDGEILDNGYPELINLVQEDEDFGAYISFISRDNPQPIASNPPKWNLFEIMTNSR